MHTETSSSRNIRTQEIFDDDNGHYNTDSKYCVFNIATLF